MNLPEILTPELTQSLNAIALNGLGALAGNLATQLTNAGGRRLRQRFGTDELQDALARVTANAIAVTVVEWHLPDPAYEEQWKQLGEWLLEPVVLGEFRVLLDPGRDVVLDMDLLREEFEAAGLDITQLSQQDFDELIQDIIGGFYAAAAEEAVLQEPLKINLLRQLAQQTGALTRLAERQVQYGRRSVGQLERLNLVADRIAEGYDQTNLLLREILVVLEERPSGVLDQQKIYQTVMTALSKAGIYDFDPETVRRISTRIDTENADQEGGSKESASSAQSADQFQEWVGRDKVGGDQIDVGDVNGAVIAVGREAKVEIVPDLSEIGRLLAEIRDSVSIAGGRLSVDELTEIERHYRQSLVDQFTVLSFRGISPSGRPIALPLADVYVELKAVADVPEAADTYSADERRLMVEAEELGLYDPEETKAHLDVMRLERWRKEARRQREEEQRRAARLQCRSIGEIIADPNQRGLVILGDPGSGKTTLLHYLALTHAQPTPEFTMQNSPFTIQNSLPIFLPLAAYDEHIRRTNNQRLSLTDFLAIYYEEWRSLPGLNPLFQDALESGRALILLDGLDEVLETTTRQHVAEQAGAMIQQWQGRGNRFVVTSRVVGYREARLPGNLPHVTVLDFGRPEIELFAKQWCRVYEVWAAGKETPTALQQATTEEQSLLEDVRSNSSVEQLAANPLLSTMLAILRRQVGKLPDRRVELYERYVRTLIDNRERERSPGARQRDPARFDPHRAIAYLIELALWLQMHRPSGTARRSDLEQALAHICLRLDDHEQPTDASRKAQLQAQQDATAFLNDMRHFAGLLAERGRDAFGFLHLTFQEYFAGRALARMKPRERWQVIQPNLHTPRWREPILLCAGELGVIEHRRREAHDLAHHILKAKSDYESILHRDLFLAVSMAADDVGLPPALFDELHQGLIALQDSSIPTIQQITFLGLAHLGRLGHLPARQTLLDGLEDEKRYPKILPRLHHCWMRMAWHLCAKRSLPNSMIVNGE